MGAFEITQGLLSRATLVPVWLDRIAEFGERRLSREDQTPRRPLSLSAQKTGYWVGGPRRALPRPGGRHGRRGRSGRLDARRARSGNG